MEPESLRQVARICAPHSKILDYTEDHEESGPADNELERIDMISRPASHVYALVKIGKLAEVTAALSKIPDITFYVAPSTRDNDTDYMGVQVNHVAADKFHGVNALRDIIGVAKDHTLAIGDGDNDLALFKNAAFKIAMGNATGLLKAAADHVVAPVQQDGFAEAMQRFVLA